METEPTQADIAPIATELTTELAGHIDTTNVSIGEADSTLVEEELLVEEISIDGMCGVY